MKKRLKKAVLLFPVNSAMTTFMMIEREIKDKPWAIRKGEIQSLSSITPIGACR